MDEIPKIYDARVAKEDCASDVEDHRHWMELCILGIHGQLITTEPILSGGSEEEEDQDRGDAITYTCHGAHEDKHSKNCVPQKEFANLALHHGMRCGRKTKSKWSIKSSSSRINSKNAKEDHPMWMHTNQIHMNPMLALDFDISLSFRFGKIYLVNQILSLFHKLGQILVMEFAWQLSLP